MYDFFFLADWWKYKCKGITGNTPDRQSYSGEIFTSVFPITLVCCAEIISTSKEHIHENYLSRRGENRYRITAPA